MHAPPPPPPPPQPQPSTARGPPPPSSPSSSPLAVPPRPPPQPQLQPQPPVPGAPRQHQRQHPQQYPSYPPQSGHRPQPQPQLRPQQPGPPTFANSHSHSHVNSKIPPPNSTNSTNSTNNTPFDPSTEHQLREMTHLADDAISKRRAELKKLQMASQKTHSALAGGFPIVGHGSRLPAPAASAPVARRLDPSFAPVARDAPPSSPPGPPKSPFGHARAVIRPALGAIGVLPPLAAEPPALGRRISAVNPSVVGKPGGGGGAVERKSRIPSLGNGTAAAARTLNHRKDDDAGDDETKTETETEKEKVKDYEEEKGTEKDTARAENDERDEAGSPPTPDSLSLNGTPVDAHACRPEADGATAAPTKEADAIAAPVAASANLARLAEDLQRTEREKKEALDQVAKMKRLLEGVSVGGGGGTSRGNGRGVGDGDGDANHTLEGNFRRMELEHRRENNRDNRDKARGANDGNDDDDGKYNETKDNDIEPISPILQQIKQILHSKGETAAIDWIHHQMKALPGNAAGTTTANGGQYPPSSRSRGRDPTLLPHRSSGNVLTSLVPPLTPRSRPGSRAASPERGGGKGLSSLSQTLLSGVANGGAGSSSFHRGNKRGMTPVPKRGAGGRRTTELEAREREPQQEEEKGDREFFVAAAKSIANEYWTDAATFFVRRPYVIMEDKGVIPAEQGVYGGSDLGGDEYHGDGNHDTNGENTTDNGNFDKNAKSNNHNIWSTYPYFSSDEDYLHNATIKDPHSLEILAFIDADGSIMTLTGESNVRHGKVPVIVTGGSFSEDDELDWAIFDHVEEMDRSLGCVAYIDGEGNDCEYWLDDIYEDAIKVRESYCVAVSAAATALKDNSKLFPPPAANQQHLHYHPQMHSSSPGMHMKPQYNNTQSNMQGAPDQFSSNASMPPIDDIQPKPSDPSVNRDEPSTNSYHTPRSPVRDHSPSAPGNAMPPSPQRQFEQSPLRTQHKKQLNDLDSTSKEMQHLQQQQRQQHQQQKQKHPNETKSPPPEEFEDANSALATMIVSLFSLLLSLVWVIIKIPFKLIKNALTVAIFAVTLKLVWLYLADDNGAWDIGAGVMYEYNMPGIH